MFHNDPTRLTYRPSDVDDEMKRSLMTVEPYSKDSIVEESSTSIRKRTQESQGSKIYRPNYVNDENPFSLAYFKATEGRYSDEAPGILKEAKLNMKDKTHDTNVKYVQTPVTFDRSYSHVSSLVSEVDSRSEEEIEVDEEVDEEIEIEEEGVEEEEDEEEKSIHYDIEDESIIEENYEMENESNIEDNIDRISEDMITDEYVELDKDEKATIEDDEIEEDIDEKEGDENIETISLEDELLKVNEENEMEYQYLTEEEWDEEILETDVEELMFEDEMKTDEQEVDDHADILTSTQPEDVEKHEELKKRRFKTIKIIKKVKKIIKKKKQAGEATGMDLSEAMEGKRRNKKEHELSEEETKKLEMLFKELKEKLELLRQAKKYNQRLLAKILDVAKPSTSLSEKTTPEMTERYKRRLHKYEEMKEIVKNEKEKTKQEINEIEGVLKTVDEDYEEHLQELLAKEMEIGIKYVVDKDGKHLDPVFVQGLVKKHETLLRQEYQTQVNLSILKQIIASKEKKLKSINICDGMESLFTYEQMKQDNTNCREKIDERETDIKHLRTNILDSVHKAAHVGDMTNLTLSNLTLGSDYFKNINSETINLRSNIVMLKTNRDRIREKTRILRNKGGILFYPKLAVDYKETVDKITALKRIVNDLETKFETRNKIVRNLKCSLFMRNNRLI